MFDHSIWLLPAPDQEQRLVRTIERLSLALGGQVFAPHLTIQGDLDLPLEKLAAALEPLAATVGTQRWRVARVEHSEFFFRCVYLRFGSEPVFDALQASMRDLSGSTVGLSPYPHLSLTYGPPHPDKARLCEELSRDFAGHELLFDRIAICRSSSRLAIADWACLAQYALGP